MSPHRTEHDGYPPAEEWLIGAPKGRPDRWAHRRGEPRGFALIWSCYLLGACLFTLFGPASSLSFDAMHIRAASKMLIALVMLGIVVVWPMFRLSQAPPRSPSRASLADLLIALAPCLAIVASTSILTRWPMQTSGAMLTLACSWSFMIAGFLAWTMRWERSSARAVSMIAVLALAHASLVIALVLASGASQGGQTPDPEAWRIGRLLAPVAAPFALSSHPTPAVPLPDALAWRAVLAPLAPALAFWMIAGVSDLAGGRGRPARPDRAANGYS